MKMRNKVMPAQVKFANETVRFEYRPGRINGEYNEEINVAQRSNDWHGIYGCMCKVLTDWNLEAEYVRDGENSGLRLATEGDPQDSIEVRKIPLEADAIIEADIPSPLMIMIEQKYQEEAANGGLQGKR